MSKVVARFEKVSYEEFKKAWKENRGEYYQGEDSEERIRKAYDRIKLPERSTKRSSGYDFYFPGIVSLTVNKGESVLIPTGIRCVFLKDGYDLSIYPRSGIGCKYRAHLDNTVGVIDNKIY